MCTHIQPQTDLIQVLPEKCEPAVAPCNLASLAPLDIAGAGGWAYRGCVLHAGTCPHLLQLRNSGLGGCKARAPLCFHFTVSRSHKQRRGPAQRICSAYTCSWAEISSSESRPDKQRQDKTRCAPRRCCYWSLPLHCRRAGELIDVAPPHCVPCLAQAPRSPAGPGQHSRRRPSYMVASQQLPQSAGTSLLTLCCPLLYPTLLLQRQDHPRPCQHLRLRGECPGLL